MTSRTTRRAPWRESWVPGTARGFGFYTGRPCPRAGWASRGRAIKAPRQPGEKCCSSTDADTVHEPALLGQAVQALLQGPDAVTVVGDQAMETFWERLIQPQVFFGMALVYSNLRDAFEQRRWRMAIANGQFLVFRRDSYDRLGGHRAVRGEVAEDLRLAQLLVRDGFQLVVHDGRGQLSTRMYQSLAELVEGWSKNMARGARLVAGRWGAIGMVIGSLLAAPTLWLGPPVLAVLGLVGWVSTTVMTLGLAMTAINMILWSVVTRYIGAPAVYGLLYPLGAAVAWVILARSVFRGRRVRWKDRDYRIEMPT